MIVVAKIAFILCILVMTRSAMATEEDNVWDNDVEQKQIILNVPYHGKYLGVWQQKLEGNRSRFYVSPLCMIDFDNAKCIPDDYSTPPKFIFSFTLKLWDSKVESIVFKALQKGGFDPALESVLPLPMKEIRFGLAAAVQKKVKVDPQWQSYLGHEFVKTFHLYTKKEKECLKLLNMANTAASNFIDIFKPYVEFKIVSKLAETRNIEITGTTIRKSSLFNKLKNKYANQTNGIVYLQSKDINKLAEDLLTKVVYKEEITQKYLESEAEKNIIESLVNEFQQQQISVPELKAEDWNSVFWEEDYARPDIVTAYATDVFNHSVADNTFTFDEKKDKEFRENFARTGSQEVGGSYGADFLGLLSAKAGAKVKNTQSDSGGHLSHNKTSLSVEDINKYLSTQRNSAKWTGEKFVPKDLDLYRLNTKDLTSSNEVLFNKKITSKAMSKQQILVSIEDKNLIEDVKRYDTTTTTTTTTTPSTTTEPSTKITTKRLCNNGVLSQQVITHFLVFGSRDCEH